MKKHFFFLFLSAIVIAPFQMKAMVEGEKEEEHEKKNVDVTKVIENNTHQNDIKAAQEEALKGPGNPLADSTIVIEKQTEIVEETQLKESGHEEKLPFEEPSFDISRLSEKILFAKQSQQAWKEEQQRIASISEELSLDEKNNLLKEVEEDVDYWNQQRELALNVSGDVVEQHGKELFKFDQAARAALQEAKKTQELLENILSKSGVLESKTERLSLQSSESSRSSSEEHEKELQQFKKLQTPDPNLSTEEKASSYYASEIVELLNLHPSREKKEQEPSSTVEVAMTVKVKSLLEKFSQLIRAANPTSKEVKVSPLAKTAPTFRKEVEQLQSSAHSLAQKAQTACEELEYATAISAYNEALQLGSTALSHAQNAAQTYQSSAWRKIAAGIADTLKIKIKDWNIGKCQVVQKFADEERKEALEQGRLADQEESNEIGNTWDSIASKYEVIKRHYKNAEAAYDGGDDLSAKEAERKAAVIQGRIDDLDIRLKFLKEEMEKWKRDYQTEASRYLETQEEPQSDGTKIVRKIYKRRFIGPLLRIEEHIDAHGGVITKVEMAAEYLMIELKRGERPAALVEKLKEDFPDNNLSIELVESNSSLYSLNFQPAASSHDPVALLNLFTQIKKTIEEKKLAVACFPDGLLELASDKAPLQKTEKIPEPWSLHSPFGINPPINLFDAANPAVPAIGRPIRVAVLDTGIRNTHQAFRNKILLHEDEYGELCFGYDAFGLNEVERGRPRDNYGHGTHVAGIIAGLPHPVTQVEVKTHSDPDLFETHPIDEAIIRGVASMPEMVELLICKNFEPGQVKNFVKRTLECIQYAREQGAQVINCSWGGAQDNVGELSPENLERLKRALGNPYEIFRKDETGEEVSYEPPRFASPAVVIAAAGNLRKNQDPQERDKDLFHSYPAGFPLPNAMAVAATKKDGELANFSYYGKQSVQITAPGTRIISASCSGDNAYRMLSGTSMATPLATSAAVLVMKRIF